VLAIIGKIGTAGGTGYTIEFAGSAIRALSMEGRMTVCNMAIEAGARAGLVAVDEKTIDYVKGRPLAPTGVEWDQAVAYWRTLQSDPGAQLRRRGRARRAQIPPQVTWGTSPEMVLGINGRVPDPDKEKDAGKRGAIERALVYMGLEPNKAIERHLRRQGVHRLLHQQPHRGHARSRRGGEAPWARRWPERQAGDGGARLRRGEGTGRARRPGRDLQGRGVRMARAGLLDVPGHERRPAGARRALRIDQQPQLRRPPGRRRPHPPREPAPWPPPPRCHGHFVDVRHVRSEASADTSKTPRPPCRNSPSTRASSPPWTARTSTPTRSSRSSS
jgi:hypothetical protein